MQAIIMMNFTAIQPKLFGRFHLHFLIIWVMQGHYDNGWFRFAKVRSTLCWLTFSIDSCTNFAKTSLPSDRGKPLTFLQWFMSEFLTWFDMSASCFNGTINGNTWGGPDTWSAPSIDYPPRFHLKVSTILRAGWRLAILYWFSVKIRWMIFATGYPANKID